MDLHIILQNEMTDEAGRVTGLVLKEHLKNNEHYANGDIQLDVSDTQNITLTINTGKTPEELQFDLLMSARLLMMTRPKGGIKI